MDRPNTTGCRQSCRRLIGGNASGIPDPRSRTAPWRFERCWPIRASTARRSPTSSSLPAPSSPGCTFCMPTRFRNYRRAHRTADHAPGLRRGKGKTFPGGRGPIGRATGRGWSAGPGAHRGTAQVRNRLSGVLLQSTDAVTEDPIATTCVAVGYRNRSMNIEAELIRE